MGPRTPWEGCGRLPQRWPNVSEALPVLRDLTSPHNVPAGGDGLKDFTRPLVPLGLDVPWRSGPPGRRDTGGPGVGGPPQPALPSRLHPEKLPGRDDRAPEAARGRMRARRGARRHPPGGVGAHPLRGDRAGETHGRPRPPVGTECGQRLGHLGGDPAGPRGDLPGPAPGETCLEWVRIMVGSGHLHVRTFGGRPAPAERVRVHLRPMMNEISPAPSAPAPCALNHLGVSEIRWLEAGGPRRGLGIVVRHKEPHLPRSTGGALSCGEMEPAGIEPATSCLQSRRSPN